MKRLTILSALLLQGCALIPNNVLLEQEHVSHPLAGWPVGPSSEEACLDQTSAIAEYTSTNAYLHVGVGYKTTDCGFYGPRVTGTIRFGYKIRIKE
jgi:hypothetical protein